MPIGEAFDIPDKLEWGGGPFRSDWNRNRSYREDNNQAIRRQMNNSAVHAASKAASLRRIRAEAVPMRHIATQEERLRVDAANGVGYPWPTLRARPVSVGSDGSSGFLPGDYDPGQAPFADAKHMQAPGLMRVSVGNSQAKALGLLERDASGVSIPRQTPGSIVRRRRLEPRRWTGIVSGRNDPTGDDRRRPTLGRFAGTSPQRPPTQTLASLRAQRVPRLTPGALREQQQALQTRVAAAGEGGDPSRGLLFLGPGGSEAGDDRGRRRPPGRSRAACRRSPPAARGSRRGRTRSTAPRRPCCATRGCSARTAARTSRT